MLVTKREAKQASKKLLSVLLAVIMMMSSMSVCFSVFAADANDYRFGEFFPTYSEDALTYLAAALEGETIKKVADNNAIGKGTSADGKSTGGSSTSGDTRYYTTYVELATYDEYVEVRDTIIYLHKAILETTNYSANIGNTSDNASGQCVTFTGIKTELLNSLKRKNANTDISAEGQEFINYILADSHAVKHSDKSKNKVNGTVTNTLSVYTKDYKGYLETVSGDYNTVASSFDMGYTYSLKMTGKHGNTNLNWNDGGSCGGTNYYHHFVWKAYWDPKDNPPAANVNNSDAKTTLAAYAKYVDDLIKDNSFDVLAGKTLKNIEDILEELDDKTATIKAYIADAGEGKQDEMYNKLFPGYASKITTFIETAEKAKEIAAYTETVAEITAYQTNNPNYGVFSWGKFDEATIKADYAEFMGKYGSIINDATLYEYFVKQGSISKKYIDDFKDNAIAYDLEDLKEDKILPLYNKYALSFPMEGGEEIPLNEKQSAYSELSGYINNVRSYTAQVQNAIFPESLNQYLDLQEKLECQVAECVLYFAEHVGKDYSNVATDAVITEIGTAKAQLVALNNLKNSIDYADNTALLDSAFENADEFISYLYSLLAERFTTQVNVADEAYTAAGRPTSLSLGDFSRLNVYLSAIEESIMTFIDGAGKSSLITQETRAIYDALKVQVFPAFDAFKVDRGFNNYSPEDVLIRREDDSSEIFRENADLDKDGVGEYEVTDANVTAIIDILEAALNDPTVAGLLGSLINKDEAGNPTGEAFDLAGMLEKLIEENVYSDALINTIVGFLYPAVANIFTNVWSGIEPVISDNEMEVMGQKLNVYVDLYLKTVEEATNGLGLPLFPKELAAKIRSEYPTFNTVADVLDDVTTKAYVVMTNGNPVESTRKSPWNDSVLYTAKLDKDGKPVVNEETGETTMVLNLDWGIDKLTGEAKRERFLNAAQAALSGVEPLLLALLCNKPMQLKNPSIGTGEGRMGGYFLEDVPLVGDLTITYAPLDVHTVNLALNASANDGYNNVIAPLFEILTGEKAPDANNFTSSKQFLEEGLLNPLDDFIDDLEANPLEVILDVIPNLFYAIEADLLLSKLDYLSINIDYSASAIINADLNRCTTTASISISSLVGILSGMISDLTGLTCESGVLKDIPANDVMSDSLPVVISGPDGFLNIEELLGGADLSSFAGIWSLISGLVPMLANVPAPDASYIASLGTLGTIDTVRSKKPYTYGGEGKAAYITANRADVLQYLVKWVLESGLLGGLVAEPSELIATIFDNLEKNPGDAVAAIVELLNQQAYPAKEYEWFNGSIDGKSVVGNSAYEIYLNPGNDWTKDKANYLYNNLDAIVAQILTLAKVDLDKTTEDVDGSLGEVIGGAIGGLLSDKTLTALAGALAGLDLNALINKDKTPEEAAKSIDVNALIKQFLDIDLSVFTAENSIYATVAGKLEADKEYVHNFGVAEGTSTFAAELAKLIAPLGKVLDFILAGKNLTITINGETVTLLGAEGYNNGLIPLLEALGIDAVAATEGKTGAQILEYVVNALVARINTLTTGNVIQNIVNLLPGVFYFITSNGLSTTVLNLLQPVVVILDTIRPIVDVMAIINNLEVGEEGAKQKISELLGGPINLERLDLGFIFGLLPALVPGLNLSGLVNVIYDICNNVGVEYTSKTALANTTANGKAKRGALNANFDGADLLTVVLSFVLEWATIKDNAKALDELLGTDGLIENIGKVFADVKIEYGTPTWYYWFADKAAFNEYIAGNTDLPNTLAALTYPNDWNEETAQYIADELPELVDMVIALINKDKGEDAPKTLSALLNGLIYGDMNITVQEADAENGTEAVVINYLFSDETINALLGLLKGILANVDDALLGAGYILDVDVVGLKNYTCTKDITTIDAFFAELAYVLDTYAKGLVDLLFFGDDFRIAKKSDKTDTIVINGGLGYEKGLALILEALGCDAPAADEATTANVLAALAARVTEILAKPVEEVIDLLPNLVYFLNADGASVAVNNLLAPVYALLDKINGLGLLEKEIDLAELLGFDLKYLSLADILALVKDKTGLDLSAAEEILVNLCIGKIDQVEYGYKMTADRKDTITVILTTALMLVSDEDFAAKLDELLGQEIISSIKTVFESTPVQYGTPNWDYCWDETDVDYVEGTIGVIESALTYPNDWSEEKAKYLAAKLPAIVDTVVAMIDINGTKYATLADLIDANVNIYTPDLLKMIQKALGDLIGGLDADLKALVNVGLGTADELLGADVNGLLTYNVEGVNDKASFVAALTGMLMEVEGLVDWLLLGEDYKLFVDDKNNNGAYDAGEDIITLNGGHGYAEGLALVLEALGCQNLPTVYDKETIDTEATVKAVLTSLTDRIDAVLADPVNEAIDLLPNLIYFLNTNGVAVAVDNLLGAFNALAVKLAGFGLNLDLNALINIQKLMKIEGKGATISLDNLAMKDILQAVSLMFGFDLTVLEGTLNGFALGEVAAYESVSRTDLTFKMGYNDEFAKYDMITVLVTAILNVATAEGNEAAIKALLGENADIYDTILKLISGAEISYSTPDWEYCWDENGQATGETIPVIESALTYPNDWNKEAVEYLTDNLPTLVDTVVKMVTKNDEASLSQILTDNVNVFNADTLNSLVKEINKLLSGIDAGLIEAAGILLDVKLVGEDSLATYVAPKDVDTVEEFAAELANVLTTYAGGVVEWLLLGESYTFFVNDADKDGAYDAGEDVITINGAHGYAEGLALLLEALGCKNLPAVYDAEGKTLENLDTTEVVNGVLKSLAARITEIFANPVKEVIDLLPNLLYFLNANGVAAVVDNLTAALSALLNELTVFGINLDINSLINIPELMGIADKYAEGDDVISLDNLTLKAILKAVSLMTGLDLTVLEAVLADFALGEVAEYDSVSSSKAYKMSYSDEFDKHHMVTVLLTSVLLAVFETEGNAEKLAEMLDTDIITAIEDVFNSVEIEYKSINWDYIEKDNGGDYMLTYPNNWNKDTATAVAELLKDK
ncbi:MAG: hypothetical protein IJ349_05860 [Clostridia bacterium]|nr:hypothetical protein [Clostridia bacterium]